MTDAERLALVISQGPDLGARLDLDASPRLLGRARDAGLVLTDPATSRRHVEARAEGGHAVLRVLDGASPIVCDGTNRSEARLAVGARFLIGGTTVTVTRAATARAPSDQELTDVRGLLQGAGGDARGLASIFALVDALDASSPESDPTDGLATWASEAFGATAARVLDVDEAAADPTLAKLGAGELVVLPLPGGTAVVVPARTHATGAVRFDLPQTSHDLGLTVRRMLIVGARVFAQQYAAWLLSERSREDQALLRAQAVGTARSFLGASPAAQEVLKVLPRLAASDATVLLLGASGSGKTFLARLIHEAGPREREPMRIVNCAAIPEDLIESALFGHERGAFTGASAAQPGVFEAAGRGTVLLDEIGEMPTSSQAKLLRVLEDRVFERIGSQRELPLRARVLAATNRDLTQAVKDGAFRSDLFFRISVVSVRLPELHERGDDVVLLARRLLADLAANGGRRVSDLDASAIDALRAYSWPGNVRELRNALEHALVLGDGPLVTAADLPASIRAAGHTVAPATGDAVTLPARLDWLEARAIEAAMKVCGGNRTRAAALLGINRVTLYKKLKEPPTAP